MARSFWGSVNDHGFFLVLNDPERGTVWKIDMSSFEWRHLSFTIEKESGSFLEWFEE